MKQMRTTCGKGVIPSYHATVRSIIHRGSNVPPADRWFNSASNPNNAVTLNLNLSVPTECGINYYHKTGIPTPNHETNFTECLPYQEEACCKQTTVQSAAYLNEAYGAGFEWDRCGKMSSACERFFVQEVCLYECDVNDGLFRKCSPARQADKNDAECHMVAFWLWFACALACAATLKPHAHAVSRARLRRRAE